MFGILKDIRFHAYLLAALAFFALWNVNANSARAMRDQSAKLEQLIGEANNFKTTLNDLRNEQQATQDAIRRLGEQARRQEQVTKQLSQITRDIQNARPEDDGPIAPVLRNTLNSVDGLRKQTTGEDGEAVRPPASR